MTLRKNISTIAHIAIMATIFLVSSTGFTLVNSMLKIGAIIQSGPLCWDCLLCPCFLA